MSDDYKVGYKNPPKHSQFAPGVSGNKGRRKPLEPPADMIARVRDELVVVNGKPTTKLELAVTQVLNQTIRSGRTRDLKALLELLDKYGAIPETDRLAEMKRGHDDVLDKIMTVFHRTRGIDPADSAALDRLNLEEAKLVLTCLHCGPRLKGAWATPERKALAERYGKTALHKQVENLQTSPDPSKR